MNKKLRKLIYVLFAIIAIVLAILFLTPVKYFWENNIANHDHEIELFIAEGSSFDDVVSLLKEQNALKNYHIFDIVAGVLKYKSNKIPSGRYVLNSPMSTFSIVRKLRSGDQTPLNITFNNLRTINDLAGKLGSRLFIDSSLIMEKINNDSFLTSIGYNRENILSLFIPNTYQMFWNISVDKLFDRMKNEHDKFWSSRQVKLDSLGMTDKDIYTLASIVEKETIVGDEKPKIASVYLNRLKTGMKLQADPTVVFATGDFTMTRVYHKHLTMESPYNTYMNYGLPPGPICMPDVSTIDAVINCDITDYIFFCASPDGSGRHLFAVDLAEHARNANKYRKWLDELKVN